LTIQDLLFHLPYRYIDRTRITPLGALIPGQEAYIQGKIELTQIQYGRRRSLLCRLDDGTGFLLLRFFHFSQYQHKRLKNGIYLRCWGQIRRGSKGLEMIHPEYYQIAMDELDIVDNTLTPVYSTTEGITQARFRKLGTEALSVLDASNDIIEELIPVEMLPGKSFPSLKQALTFLHRPPANVNVEALLAGEHAAQIRLIFEELLAQQLAMRVLRQKIQQHSAQSFKGINDELIKAFLEQLPFTLTTAQQKVDRQIQTDLEKTVPMLRLIQGDVGSGKTIIAALAAIRAISAGMQVAFMAPTELLAEQHYFNFRHWMEQLSIEILLLTGKLAKSKRNDVVGAIDSGKPVIIIGTHALFQEGVKFCKLGLVIIDEQHRFGVDQRLALIEKGTSSNIKPHQLIMTATPIPRTLAMSLFAELDVSTIDELPPGRKAVVTVVLSNQKRNEIIKRINKVCSQGQQVYWVCPLIEESDVMQCQAAIKTHESLTEILPQLSVGLIHGRLRPVEKQKIMTDFNAGQIQLLVATTVIEVGVDVPNASLMIIENAERMGLSQLHQLRGRVGRGIQESNCVLLYQSPLSEMARTRLELMRNCNDGFLLAEKDLELRGPGDMLGTRQTGMPQMRIANLSRDARYLPQVRKIADLMLQKHPDLVKKLARRWLSNRIEYGKV
jgi:ATP-dependent DNA helicase RecG